MIEWLRSVKIRVEVLYLLFGFSLMFESSVTTNFLLYRTCYATLGYSKEDCYLLGTKYANNKTNELETKVQFYTTYIIISKDLIEAFIAPIFGFLLASWSDKCGRRPLMLLGLAGSLMSYLVMTIVSSIPYISPWYFLLHEIPFCLSGSKISIMAACLSYTADTIPEDKRGIRLGFLEAAANIGMLIGTSSCSYVFAAFGYSTVYVICVSCQFFAWMFTWYYVEESLNVEGNQVRWRSFFELSPIEDAVTLIFRRREHDDRALLLCIFGVQVLFIGGKYSNGSVIFLYLRQTFFWTLERFTLFLAFSLIMWIFVCLVCLKVLISSLRVRETTAIIISLFVSILGYTVISFANQSWQIYGAACLLSVGSCVPPLAQYLLSTVVPKEEIGRLYAALVSCNAISLLLSSTLNTYIYNQTISTFPKTFTFVTVAIFAVALMMAVVLAFLYNRRRALNVSVLDT